MQKSPCWAVGDRGPVRLPGSQPARAAWARHLSQRDRVVLTGRKGQGRLGDWSVLHSRC